MKAFLYHTSSGRMYEVVKVENGEITLKNSMATFTDTYDKEKFKLQGYIRVKGEDEDEARAAAEALVAAEAEAE
jgi:hypothetical protein